MHHDKRPREQVFLVRMWAIQTSDKRHAWRGSVQHVASGRKLYISGLADLVEFVTSELSDSTTEEDFGS
jgi:hypothetical protein